MNVRWLEFTANRDERGCLTALEAGRDLPFKVERIFFVHDTIPGVPRGGHAHRRTDQVLVGLGGTITVTVTDGIEEQSFDLCSPDRGLFVGRMLWTDLQSFTDGAILLVLASDIYDRSQSLRTWDEFLAARSPA